MGGQVSHAVRLGSSLSLLDLGGVLEKPAEKGKVSEGGCVPAIRAPSRPVYRRATQTNGHLHQTTDGQTDVPNTLLSLLSL